MTNLPIIAASAIEVINDEPRVQDTVLAAALKFEATRNIRKLIKSHEETLKGFGEIALRLERLGRNRQETNVYYLNEEQALVYKTGDDKGETKEVATSKQAGRIISNTERLLAMLDTPNESLMALATLLAKTEQRNMMLQAMLQRPVEELARIQSVIKQEVA